MKCILLIWIPLMLISGCTRHYVVHITNVGDLNTVSIEVLADVPKTISTDAVLDVDPGL